MEPLEPQEGQTPATDDAARLSLEFDLAPAWARTSPEAHHRRYDRDGRDGGEGREPFERRGSPRDRFGGRDRRPPRGGGDRPRGPRPPGGRPDRGPRRDERRDERRDFRPREEAPPLPLDIRVLPDQKALGAVIRRIQTTRRAYPLREIARLFLDNPAAHQMRIEPRKGETLPLFQCRVCGMPGLDETEIRTHLLAAHLGHFFDVAEIEADPPAGNFVCVARCGLSGELLGPPNHHSFNARVQEMLRTRFAGMSEESYRSRIEMVRDPEVVNQWREQSRKKKVYRRKVSAEHGTRSAESENLDTARPPLDTPAPTPEPRTLNPEPSGAVPAAAGPAPLGPPLDRQAAELVFLREILPGQVLAAKHMVCPGTAARQTVNRRLADALRDAFLREQKFPAAIFFALRGAFHHRKLHLFRATHERGPDFVVAREPVALDAAHVVAELGQVLDRVTRHPGGTRAELLAEVSGGDEARAAHFATCLNTLVEKAHVIEYFNGVLALPAPYPMFRQVTAEEKKSEVRSQKSEEAATPAVDTPVAAEAPAAETPAAEPPAAEAPLASEPGAAPAP
jgi:hypothetical protein